MPLTFPEEERRRDTHVERVHPWPHRNGDPPIGGRHDVCIETGAFVLAPAQGGFHEDGRGTYGHSLVIAPWGEILGEARHDEPAVVVADLDLAEVDKARQAIPVLKNERAFVGP